jgi:hypothetical protein
MGRKFNWMVQTPSIWLVLTTAAITAVATGISEYEKISKKKR